MRARRLAVVVIVACLVGFGFAAVSTYDSVAHLDRQVHGIHCSYFLGLGRADATGSSGCHTTLMSPYSSMFRQAVWGGIPVALAGMSVFAFLLFWTIWLVQRGLGDRRGAGFLFLGTALPLIASLVMGYWSIVELDVVCKTCVGIYLASGVSFAAAGALFYVVRRGEPSAANPDAADGTISWLHLTGAFGLGILFVALPVGAYAALAPDYSHYVGNCGTLKSSRDTSGVLVPYGPQESDVEMIEILDPLCNACGLLQKRIAAMGDTAALSRKVLLFPLDNTCNWMVDEAIHPGACAVSEAVLCADGRAGEVLDWALEHQHAILQQSKRDPAAAREMAITKFPFLNNCIGSTAVRAELNLALRWAVKNQLQVLTPQLYVRGLRLCDEDTDLGLDFALSRLIARARVAPAENAPRIDDQGTGKPPLVPVRPSKPKPATVERTKPVSPIAGDASPVQADDEEEKALDEKLKRVKQRLREMAETTPDTAEQEREPDTPAEPLEPGMPPSRRLPDRIDPPQPALPEHASPVAPTKQEEAP